jgi:hypothetical protein
LLNFSSIFGGPQPVSSWFPCLGLFWIPAFMTFTRWFAWESWLMSRTSKVLSPTLMVHNLLFWEKQYINPTSLTIYGLWLTQSSLLLNCILGWEGMKRKGIPNEV